MRWLFSLILFLTVVGCSKSPRIPDIDRLKTPGPDRVVLDDKLTPKDIREIFRAINKDNKLSALKPYLEDASDAELSELAELASKYLYVEAHVSNGALAILERRIAAKSFSSLATTAKAWAAEPSQKKELDAILAVLADEETPKLATGDIAFVNPRWSPILKKIWGRGAAYTERATHKQWPPIAAQDLHQSLRKIFDSGTDQKLVSLAGVLVENDFVENVMKATTSLRARKDTQIFEGVGRGIASMLPTKESPEHKLQKLLDFIEAADKPTNGLFTLLSERLRTDNTFVGIFSSLFTPVLSKSAAMFTRETMTAEKDRGVFYDKAFWTALPARVGGAPTPQFKELLTAIRGSLTKVTDNEFNTGLSAYVAALQMERVLEPLVKTDAWKNAPAENFHKNVWSFTTVEVDSKNIDINTPAYLQELKKLDLESIAVGVEKASLAPVLGSFQYLLRPVSADADLHQALASAISDVQSARPISSMETWVNVFIGYLSRPESTHLSLQDFETSNLLDSINRFLGALSFPKFLKADAVLFETIQVGKIPPDLRDVMVSVYDARPELKAHATKILETIQSLHDLNEPIKETYHAFLTHTRPDEIRGVGATFGFLGSSGFLSQDSGAPRFPAIYQFFERGTGLSRLLYGLSWLEPSERKAFIEPFPGVDKIGAHFDLLNKTSVAHPDGVTALIDRTLNQATEWIGKLDEMPALERAWLLRFVAENDHQILWRFFKNRGSRAHVAKLAGELKPLSRNGYLREGFQILKRLDNERLRRIGAVLEQWDASGEFYPMLETLEVFSR